MTRAAKDRQSLHANRATRRAENSSRLLRVPLPISSQVTTKNSLEVSWSGALNLTELPTVLERLSGLWRRIGANTRRQRYAAIQTAVVMATHFRNEPTAWGVFCQHSEWQNAKARGRPKPDQSTEALNYVMRFIVGVGRTESQTANRHKQAAERLMNEGVAADQIAETLRTRGGVNGVLNSGGRVVSGDDDDDDVEALDEDDFIGHDENDADVDKGKPARKSSRDRSNGPLSKPATAPKATVARKASAGGSDDTAYLPMKLLLSKKDCIDILASNPVDRILLFQIKVSAIEDGKVVASVEEWGDLETQEEARARLAR